MKIGIIKSVDVANDNGLFMLHFGTKKTDIGIQVHEWGVRIMLIWWHICIHF